MVLFLYLHRAGSKNITIMNNLKKIVRTAAYVVSAAAILSVSACTKYYYYYCAEGEQNRISLSSAVQFASGQRLQDNQIFNGQTLSLFVTRTGSVSDLGLIYTNNQITSNGTGGFTYRVPMYYPSDGTAVDFFAVHPFEPTATLASPLEFVIQTDQTVQGNYLHADLLFGTRVNVTPQTTAIPLTFYHKFAKLNFVITTRSTAVDLSRLTAVSVLGSLPRTTIDIRSGNITAASGTAATIRAYGTPVVSGTSGNQTVTGFTAIVVPQTAPAAQQLFGLMIDGQTRYFTPSDNVQFLSGNKYTVNLEVAETGITMSSQIEDWTDGGTIGGVAGPR